MKRAWFKNRDWEFVVAMNAGLCQSGNALHKPTSEGYEETKAFWNENHARELTLAEAVEICRRCHRMAPFCFYNGNTFVAIIRDCIAHAPGLGTQQVTLAKSLAGHMVAGTAEPEEISQFANCSAISISASLPPKRCNPAHLISATASRHSKARLPESSSKSMPMEASSGNAIRLVPK